MESVALAQPDGRRSTPGLAHACNSSESRLYDMSIRLLAGGVKATKVHTYKEARLRTRSTSLLLRLRIHLLTRFADKRQLPVVTEGDALKEFLDV